MTGDPVVRAGAVEQHAEALHRVLRGWLTHLGHPEPAVRASATRGVEVDDVTRRSQVP